MPGVREPSRAAGAHADLTRARHRRRPSLRSRVALATLLSLVAGAVTFLGAATHHFTKRAAPPTAGHPPSHSPSRPAAPQAAAVTGTRPAGNAVSQPLGPVTLAQPALIVTPGENVPNPFVVVNNKQYVMFSSQSGLLSPNVPFRVSSSPEQWGPVLGDALPTLPAWAAAGFTWAPDVHKIGNRFVMWFTAQVKGLSPSTQCIGVASSFYLVGPYQPLPVPSVCPMAHRGAIDPRVFTDTDGSLWLDWKSDDNADVASDTHSTIFAQRLAPDGMNLVGDAYPLLTADLPWEGRIVEAPQMVAADGHYWLFYSGNWFNQPAYSIGVAQCDRPAGPCTKTLTTPWMASNAQGKGPGEGSLFHDGGGWWMVYAPWAAHFSDYVPRPVALAHVGFTPAGPYVLPPQG